MPQRTNRNANARSRSAARAETQKEAQDAFVLPHAGILMTKESAAGFALAVPLCALLGALVVLPFGFIEFAGVSMAMRLVIAAVVGAVAGAVVGFVVGPSLGARHKAIESEGAAPGRQGRPGKAEVAEATGRPERAPPKRRAKKKT